MSDEAAEMWPDAAQVLGPDDVLILRFGQSMSDAQMARIKAELNILHPDLARRTVAIDGCDQAIVARGVAGGS